MKIQLYRQFFPIKNGIDNRQPRTLARMLAERGHEVEIITDDYYQTDPSQANEFNKTAAGYWHVTRLHTSKDMKSCNVNRIKTYGIFAAKALAYGLRLPKPDLVMTSIQPMFSGLAALKIANHHHVPLAMEIRDLWPDDLVARQVISHKVGLPMVPLATALYVGSSHIFSVTPGIKRELVKKGLPDNKIDVIPVGCDAELFEQLPNTARQDMRKKYGWGDDFVIVYPGTQTEATALDVVIRAASELKDLPHVRIALFGNGQCQPCLQKLAADLKATNVEFHEPVHKSEVAQIMKAADVGLLNLQPSPLIHIFFENKFMDYMAAGLPIFGSMRGDQADIVRREDLGRIVDCGDYRQLAAELRKAASGAYDLKAMGERCHQYGVNNLNMCSLLKTYCDRLEQVARGEQFATAFTPKL